MILNDIEYLQLCQYESHGSSKSLHAKNLFGFISLV